MTPTTGGGEIDLSGTAGMKHRRIPRMAKTNALFMAVSGVRKPTPGHVPVDRKPGHEAASADPRRMSRQFTVFASQLSGHSSACAIADFLIQSQ